MTADIGGLATSAGALLVLVNGHPASGKSTLAAVLGARLGLPVLAKDDVLEALFDAGLASTHATRTAANLALLRMARSLLASGCDCIVDSNLEASRWQSRVCRLLEDSGARLLQVCCHADGEVLWRRFRARAGGRHCGHRDGERSHDLRARLLGPPLAPMDLPGIVLRYDSDGGGEDVDSVLRAVACARSGGGA